jgi:hypothetical protein
MSEEPQGEPPTLMDNTEPEQPVLIDNPRGDKPALTVVIQSWWTPILAIVALIAGLLLGFFGRPLVNKAIDLTGEVAAAITPGGTTSDNLPAVTTSTPDPTQVADNQAKLMAFLVSQTTHFKGDPNAPVTLIEFSDYQ